MDNSLILEYLKTVVLTDYIKNQWEIGEEITLFDSFPFKKIKNLTNKGGWGNVSLVKLTNANQLFVAKRPNISYSIFELGFDLNKIAIKKEARILLTMPFNANVVDCFLVDNIKGVTHIFMEYLDGGDLEDWIQKNQIPSWEMFLIIIQQIIKGMVHIHATGLIHADLKPSNILISKMVKIDEKDIPSIKISDFGLSRISDIEKQESILSDSECRREESIMIGCASNLYTKEYASPEQEIWKGCRVDKVSDIFSFGIIMAELITSVVGFKNQIKYCDIVPSNIRIFSDEVRTFLKEKRRDIPEDILKIILKCLQIIPNERYQSFDEILLDITKIDIPGVQIRNFNFSLVPTLETKILKYGLRGYSLNRLGYKDDAKIQFENSIKLEDPSISSLINIGLSYHDLCQYENAINCYDKVLNSDQIDKQLKIGALINKCMALDKIGKYEEAIECGDQALKLDPLNKTALTSKGQSLSNNKKYEEAILSFDEALRLDPNDILANCNKGIALLKLGKYIDSLIYLDKVILLDPGYLRAYPPRALSLFNIKRYNDAIKDFDKILFLESNNVQALRYKAFALFYIQKYEQTLTICDKILVISPDDIDILDIQGRTFTSLGKHNEEIRICEKILVLDPDNTQSLIRLSFVYGELGNFQKQLDYCKKALGVEPNNIEALNNLGLALSGLNKVEESLTYFDKALEISPDYILALSNKAASLMNLKRYAEALELLNKALKTDTFFKPALLMKAFIQEELGDFDEAIRNIEVVLSKKSDSPYLLNRKGILFAKSGKIDRAIECFSQVLETNPDYKPALDNKELALSLKKTDKPNNPKY